MIKLVITGSIGMGKSTTAKMFAKLGGAQWTLYDADEAVHRLYQKNGAAVAPIAEIFPAAIKDGAVNRAALSKIVLGDADKIKKLEAIVHPLVATAQTAFIAEAQAQKKTGVIFDIPLFFETRAAGSSFADFVVIASADPDTQKKRVLARGNMEQAKLDAILTRQMPDAEKRKHADFVVETNSGMDYARTQVAAILKKIIAQKK